MHISIFLPAEWEKQEFVQIVFPHEQTDWSDYLAESIETFVNIAKNISQYQKCLVVTKDIEYIKSFFQNKENLIFTKLNSNDTWSRDFGGITINKNGSLTILDFEFNAWGKKFQYALDNQITKNLQLKGLLDKYKYESISFVLEGGAIESNGEGVILTTSKCLLEKNRNPFLSQNDIEQKLIKFFGAKKVLWLNSGCLEGDDTDSHIDTLARFISSDTIIYQSCDDISDTHFLELKQMEKELSRFTQLNGQPFKLVALPWIKAKYYEGERLPATYANFLIINDAVLVPTYNDKNDSQAINILKKQFPKREIIGIDCSTLIKQHGSLHCVTMQYPSVS